MLWTVIAILFVLWLIGMVTAYTLGGLLHILVVIAIILAVVRLIQGRRII
ncbi:MAG: lmo0937 family membrane protein [Pseudomonadota bacterium]